MPAETPQSNPPSSRTHHRCESTRRAPRLGTGPRAPRDTFPPLIPRLHLRYRPVGLIRIPASSQPRPAISTPVNALKEGRRPSAAASHVKRRGTELETLGQTDRCAMHGPVSRTMCPNTLSRRPDVRCSSRFSSSPIHHNPPTKLDNDNDNDPRAVRAHPTHLLTLRCPQGRCGVVSSRPVTGPLNTHHVVSELLSLVPEVPDPRTRRSPQLARNATRPGEEIGSKVAADQGATGCQRSISWLLSDSIPTVFATSPQARHVPLPLLHRDTSLAREGRSDGRTKLPFSSSLF